MQPYSPPLSQPEQIPEEPIVLEETHPCPLSLWEMIEEIYLYRLEQARKEPPPPERIPLVRWEPMPYQLPPDRHPWQQDTQEPRTHPQERLSLSIMPSCRWRV